MSVFSSQNQNKNKKVQKNNNLKGSSSQHKRKNNTENKVLDFTTKSQLGNNSNVYVSKMPSAQVKISPQFINKNKNKDIFSLIVISLLRLGIVGVGLGTILGTVIANMDLTKPLFADLNIPLFKSSQTTTNSLDSKNLSDTSNLDSRSAEEDNKTSGFALQKKLTPLEAKFAKLQEKYPKLEANAFFIDIDNGYYADFNGDNVVPAASTIKIPILVAFFEDVDAGKIYLDEKLTVDKEVVVSGSGGMQYQGLDKKYSAIHTATEMIISSDNTATEMIIKRLGGAANLNERFESWGLENTAIHNLLPDLEGTNTTSPRDLAYILSRVNNGELISLKSRDRLLGIMEKTKTKTLLPQGLEKGAVIAHKTGDIGMVLGDAGIIDMPTGKRYIGAVLVKRPNNDYTTRSFIQEISRKAYQHFKWYLPHPPLKQVKNK